MRPTPRPAPAYRIYSLAESSAKPIFLCETARYDRAERPSKYPPASDEQREAAALCLRLLAGLDMDRAAILNGIGYNAADTIIGHELAQRSVSRSLTDGEVWLAKRVLTKYHRQLGDLLTPLKAA